jgi:hypothetical protein
MSTFSLKNLQAQCVAALQADPFFSTVLSNTGAPIPVLSESVADLQYEVSRPLDQLVSAVFLLTPSAFVTKPNLPGPYFDRIELVAEIVENPVTNQPNVTGNPSADDIAAAVAGILHQFQPNGGEECLCVTKLLQVPRPNFSVRHVEFVTQGGLAWSIPTLPSINISPAGPGPQTVTLSLASSVPGASIFYSLDGSTPTPRNAWSPQTGATSQLYQSPFTVSAGMLLRARAYLAGFLPATDSIAQY